MVELCGAPKQGAVETTCRLKAGHAGAHRAGAAAWWTLCNLPLTTRGGYKGHACNLLHGHGGPCSR